MKRVILDPQFSVSGILFGDKIEHYSNCEYESRDDITSWDTYIAPTFRPVTVWVEAGKIAAIHCDVECFWKGVNLIGLGYEAFQQLQPGELAGVDKLYVALDEEEEQEQDVYEYDDIGAQIWVYEGKIVTVIAC